MLASGKAPSFGAWSNSVVSIHANKILRKTFQRNSIGRIAASRHNPIYQVNIPVGQQVRLGRDVGLFEDRQDGNKCASASQNTAAHV